MVLENILNELSDEIKKVFPELEDELKETFNFSVIEQTLAALVNRFCARILEKIITNFLSDPMVLNVLKQIGGRMAMRFKEYRPITIRLYNGQTIKIYSPYFVKVRSKKRKKKRGPNGTGKHVGLSVIGFIGHASGNFVSEIVKLALLCPSLEVAHEVLSERGIQIDVKTIRKYCRELGILGLENRGEISVDGREELEGQTLVIGIDGGRLRERKKKRGKKKKGQKRQGYTTEWREPKLFTIYLLNTEGEVVKEFKPLHDATMGDADGVFDILQRYLKALDLSKVKRMVFCGDGATWIWRRVEGLVGKLGIEEAEIYQVIDYTHAKQNLRKIAELIQERDGKREKVYRKWKRLLWEGDIQAICESICKNLKGKKKSKALKKWNEYFHENQKRMQYAYFKENNIPCGSGCVESAIRRVINLRLKSAGIFWKRDMAEYFLFLRSQLLSKRWRIFMNNVTCRLEKFRINQSDSDNHINAESLSDDEAA